MEYRALGNTGFWVSEIGVGTWGMGGNWGPQDDAEALRALGRAFELGVNFFDTARVYGDGHGEEILGGFLKGRRDRVFVASKIPPKTYRWPVLPGERLRETFPSNWIVECTERSLRALRTDYLDVQQLHAWTDSYTEQLDWLEAFGKLKKEGENPHVWRLGK